MTIYLKRGDSGKRGDGAKGDWIVAWQAFLAGEKHYRGDYSPNYGPRTETATKAFQRAEGVGADGAVGDDTTEKARSKGFSPPWLVLGSLTYLEDPDKYATGWMNPDWPQPTDLDGDGRADLVYLSEAQRQAMWGPLEWKVFDGDPVITNDWYKKNIRRVHVPQIEGLDCYGTKSSGKILFHKLAIPQLLGAMQEIEEAGLVGDLLTFGGSYVLRFIRGSTKTLSNHGFGVAPDFNMEWNGLGKQPALVGEKGTLRRVVPIFEKWGFFWGGWYRSRKDGMHLECVKRIDTATCTKMVNQLETNEHILPWLKGVA